MMWRGLHNPERHEPSDGLASCLIESANPVMARWCTPTHPCRCCMDEEARTLRQALESLGERVYVAEMSLANVRDALDDRRRQIAGDPRLHDKVPLISIQRIEDCFITLGGDL